MKKLFLLVAVAAFVAVSCGSEVEERKASLSVSPTTLTFVAQDAADQIFTVHAEPEHVKWDPSVADDAKSWLTVTKSEDDEVVVSVINNDDAAPRTGVVTVRALNNSTVAAKEVTVVQTGSAVAPTYSLTVTPAKLIFEGAGAATQEVVVTVVGDFTWSAVPDERIASWVTLTPQQDKLIVSVSDNPTTEERSGNVTINPSESSVGAKAIRIVQVGKVLPPSLSVNITEIPLSFKFNMPEQVFVTAINTNWLLKIVEEDGVTPATWIKVTEERENSFIMISAEVNTTLTARSGYVILTATEPSVAPVRIHVIQEAGRESLTTLTDNVVISDMGSGVGSIVTFDPMWDGADILWSKWQIDLWGANLTFDNMGWPYEFIGTGTRIYLDIYTDKIEKKAGLNPVYYLPDGTYPVTAADQVANTLLAGNDFTTDPIFPSGCWYQHYDNNRCVSKAPFMEGQVTVARTSDTYTLTFEVSDDLGYTITGTCVTTFDNMTVIER